MARKKLIQKVSIEETITAFELSTILNRVLAQDPRSVVCVRQYAGTDFPPFISIESKEYHNQLNEENEFINLLIE